MLTIRISSCRAIMRVRFIDKIHAEDFSATATRAAEQVCQRHGRIELMILDVRRFTGWGDIETFTEQIRFLRRFSREIARVAVFGCPAWKGAIPAIARLFVAAEVRCFTPEHSEGLRDWLRKVYLLQEGSRRAS